MNIIMVGINHKTAPLALREKVSFQDKDLPNAYNQLKNIGVICESIILSTCNRTEIYAYVWDQEQGINELIKFWNRFISMDSEWKNHRYQLIDEDATIHLYKVASGLDSMVLGEDQILGQVKLSQQKSMETKASGPVLNSLFRYAITGAKKAKSNTSTSNIPISIASIAVKFMQNQFPDLRNKKVFILGLGKISMLTLKNLKSEGIDKVYVCNRTRKKVYELREEISGVEVIDYEHRMEVMASCDIVISSTSAPHFVVNKEIFSQFYKSEKPICFIDLALPRDVDPNITNISGVRLISLDGLQKIASVNRKERHLEALRMEEILMDEVEKFKKWYACRELLPIIKKLSDSYNEIVEVQMDILSKQLPQLSCKDKEKIKDRFKEAGNKFLSTPILIMKQKALSRRDTKCKDVLTELFDLEIQETYKED